MTVRGIRIGVLLAFALGLALDPGCASGPRPIEYEARKGLPSTADGLYRVRTRRVSAAFLKPEADFSQYDAVMIDPVRVSYKRGMLELDEQDVERFQSIFQQAFDSELSRSKVYRVVSLPGPRTLRVSGQIVNLVVRVPPFRGGEKNLVLDAGEMTLILDVRDSQSGEPLARVADRRRIRPAGTELARGAAVSGLYESNPVNNWGAVREICADWARTLREALDDLASLPVPPAPPRETN